VSLGLELLMNTLACESSEFADGSVDCRPRGLHCGPAGARMADRVSGASTSAGCQRPNLIFCSPKSWRETQ
jgi:hypothetical protein